MSIERVPPIDISVDGEEELTLIRQAALGNQDAFRFLVVIYEPKLIAYLVHMIGDLEAARDLAQDTFVAIFQSLARWQPKYVHTVLEDEESWDESIKVPEISTSANRPLAPLLYRIATNRAISYLRKQTVRARIHAAPRPQSRQDGREHDWFEELADKESLGYEERLAARELLELALKQLPAKDAACIVLHFVSGEPYAEIASRLNSTESAVRKRVSRALGVLRKIYARLVEEER